MDKQLIYTFLFKLGRLLMLLFILDQGIGLVLEQLFFRQFSGPHHHITHVLTSGREELIILGSSRATHHYVPECFSEALGLSCYNSGSGGRSVLFAHAMLDGILARYTPKKLILELFPLDLYRWDQATDRLSILLPYYHYIPEMQEVLNMRSKYEKVKMLSGIYPFNSMLLTILNYQVNEQEAYDGFRPKRGIIDSDTLITMGPDPRMQLDPGRIYALESIIQTCKGRGIDLYLVISPIYNQIDNNASLEKFEDLSSKYHVPFWNFSQHPDFLSNPDLFNDHYHLNERGATIFSKMIARKMRL